MIKISDIRAIGVKVPLLSSFNASYGIRDTADFVIIEIEDNQGRIGFGEASTIPIYSEGSQAGCIYITENYIRPLIMGLDPRDINSLNNLVSKAIKGEFFLKTAIDFALHDLVGKIYNLPVYRLLGGKRDRIEVSWVIGAKKPEKVSSEAIMKLKEGYRIFKLKVGTNTQDDIRNMEVLRKAVGDAEIRIDANEAWKTKEALDIIDELNKYLPKHIEQPVPHWDIEGLKFIKNHCMVPIVADESVQNANSVMIAASRKSCDTINIKISRCGGYREAYEMISIARAFGLEYFFGSMLELGIGTVASAHFAASFPNKNMATELVGPQLLERDVLVKQISYKEGFLEIPDGPGLGIEINTDVINEYRI